VENFVDKGTLRGLARLVSGAPDPSARKMGTKKVLKINHLPSIAGAVRPQMPCNANAGATVELSPSAGGRLRDG
jgi:hypothetical protein